MGNLDAHQRRGAFGKVASLLDQQLDEVKWGEFRIVDLFKGANGDFDIQKKHINGKGNYVITAGLTDAGILGKTDITAKIFKEKTITVDMFGNAFYRGFIYKMVTHARVFSLSPQFEITENQGLFLANAFNNFSKKFGYENMCTWEKIKKETILLPTKNNQIDFDFMESFIAKIEAEHIERLEAYLEGNGFIDYCLTAEEKLVLEMFEKGEVEWGEFAFSSIFNKIVQ